MRTGHHILPKKLTSYRNVSHGISMKSSFRTNCLSYPWESMASDLERITQITRQRHLLFVAQPGVRIRGVRRFAFVSFNTDIFFVGRRGERNDVVFSLSRIKFVHVLLSTNVTRAEERQ